LGVNFFLDDKMDWSACYAHLVFSRFVHQQGTKSIEISLDST